jgi:hypothetical protein
VGLFGNFGDGFKAGNKVRDDLQRQENGSEWRVAEERFEIAGGASACADEDEQKKDGKDAGSGPALENGASADATVVDVRKKQSNRQAEEKSWKKNGLPANAIEFERIKLRKKGRRRVFRRPQLPRGRRWSRREA